MKKNKIKQLKRTKIVATLGPALDDPVILHQALLAGANVFRANFSHGSKEDHTRRIQMVRKTAEEVGKEVAVLADLQGPKIRVARFQKGSTTLKTNATFILDASLGDNDGTDDRVGIDYKGLPQDVSKGDMLLLDDGRLVLKVTDTKNQEIFCTVVAGGELSNNKGINREGGGLSAPALTEKDKEDLKTAIDLGADYIAISFPRTGKDILDAKKLIAKAGSEVGVVAKIERAEAVKNLEEIIDASDAVMVARGDLGVEIGDAELIGVQKHIIERARAKNIPAITATQMMESMIHNPLPSRAEVSDVANAVIDGTDAVMLSAESATGKYPIKAIEAMRRVILGAEKFPNSRVTQFALPDTFQSVDEAIAMATMFTANHLHIKAIISLTESGATPLWMSRVTSQIPIYALSRHVSTQRKMALFRGVYPMHFDATNVPRIELNKRAVEALQHKKIVEEGDLVIITRGDLIGVHGRTNSMKVYQVLPHQER
jgi:pyruvate kinase